MTNDKISDSCQINLDNEVSIMIGNFKIFNY